MHSSKYSHVFQETNSDMLKLLNGLSARFIVARQFVEALLDIPTFALGGLLIVLLAPWRTVLLFQELIQKAIIPIISKTYAKDNPNYFYNVFHIV